MSVASSTANDNLETPVLDAERPRLLEQILEHGGYAYVRMAALAAGGDVRAAEVAREMAWEQLHCGPWDSVVPVWRDAYAMACLHVAKLQYAAGEWSVVLRALDMGLIMGGLTLREDLNNAVRVASAKARAAQALRMDAECGKCIFVREEELSRLKVQSCCRSLKGYPVVISDCMAEWPAMSKWNDINYLKSTIGFRTVPVEVGKNYLCQDWKQELITFSEFLERIQSKDCASAEKTYLAQHPLFDQIHELRQDIAIPDYCYAGGGEMRPLNAWFGPSGTVTPLHHDPHHNILAQVVGKKYVRLYSASLSEELYPHAESMLRNSSKVDLDDIDEREFPKVVNIEFFDCILNEGEMLYIPPKWWHYVKSLTTSFSVSFWWSDYADASPS